MKDFLLTLKFLLKQNLSFKYFFEKLKSDKRTRNMYIILTVILLLSAPSFGAFIYMYLKMFDIFAVLGMQLYFIIIAIIFSSIIIIMIGMFQITSYFYLSNDVKILTPLPIKTKHILLSKFIVVYLWEVILSIFTILPFFLIYGLKGGIDLLAWINLIISFILLPLIPLVIVGILVVFIMKLTNIFRNKDAFRMVAMLAMIILVIGFQLYIQRLAITTAGKESEYLQNLLLNNKVFIEKISYYYPIITLVKNSIIGTTAFRLISIVLYIILSIGCVYVFGFILESVYLNTYLNEQEQLTKNRKVKKESNKATGVAYSIMSVDMKTLFKVPMYALNCLSTVIIIPVILLITIISTGELKQMLVFYEPNKYLFWFICTMSLTLFGPLNMITATSFSREGKTNWIMRTLPISSSDQIKGRVLSSLIVQFAFGFISIGILLYVIKVDFFFGFLALILTMVASLPIHLIGLYIDLKHPLLKWDNPQVAVKQNTNALIIMAVSMIYGTIMVVLFIGITKIITINSLLNFFIVYLIFTFINLILSYVIYSLLDKQFDESLILMD